MDDKKERCSSHVWSGWNDYRCSNVGTIEIKGKKYCKIHAKVFAQELSPEERKKLLGWEEEEFVIIRIFVKRKVEPDQEDKIVVTKNYYTSHKTKSGKYKINYDNYDESDFCKVKVAYCAYSNNEDYAGRLFGTKIIIAHKEDEDKASIIIRDYVFKQIEKDYNYLLFLKNSIKEE